MLMFCSAFYLRVQSYWGSSTRTIDELIYYHLGANLLQQGLPGYHIQKFSELLLNIHPEFAPLPEYMTAPLFKHPPVFPALVALALKLFGESYISALYVSAFFGAMMIVLVYLIGKIFYDETTGVLAAFLTWLDPISIMSSQKIWLDPVLAFFMVAAVCLFAVGLKRSQNKLYILSGIFVGLAVLTKYPGILVFFSIATYAAFFRPELFRNRKFVVSLFIPWLMLVPWGWWCLQVYGVGFVTQQGAAHNFLPRYGRTMSIVVLLTLISGASLCAALRSAKPSWIPSFSGLRKYGTIIQIVLGGLMSVVIGRDILLNLNLTHLPYAGWYSAVFQQEATALFYFKRLTQYSLLYVLAFSSFIFRFEKGPQISFSVLAKITSLFMIAFFMLWGSFQSRYILAALPLFIILGTDTWLKGWLHFNRHPQRAVNIGGRFAFALLGIVILLKCLYINWVLSFPNDMCYF